MLLRRTLRPAVALLLALWTQAVDRPAMAQPQVPAEFQDLYAFTAQKLDAFDRSLSTAWDGSRYPVTFTTELLSANGNRGRQLLAPQALVGARLELDRLRSLGVQAVTVAIPFPILYQPFLAWNGDPGDYQLLVAFFAQVAGEAHARGMKLAVESGAMFPGIYSAGSGMNAAAYYPTLSDGELVAGRAAVIATIASEVKPDILNVGSEPDTEARLTGRAFLNTPQGFAGMIRIFVDQLAAAGLGGVPVVAGSGTWKYGAGAFVAELCKIPGLYGIDIHLYPVNNDYLDQALILAAQAHAAGKRVTMLECWLEKERDSELGTIDAASDPTIFARDPFSFWAPLDQKFLALMVKYANAARLEYISPFWSRFFFAYLDYDAVHATNPPPTADQIIQMATAAHAQALISGRTTDTGRAYASLITGTSGVVTVTKVVPIVLSVSGVGGSRFTTELTLANRGTTAASVQLVYTPATALGAALGNTVTASLAAGRQLVIPDAIEFVRNKQLGAPTPENQGGTFRVTFSGLSSADVAFVGARTTTPSGSGRAGLAYAGVSLPDAQTGSSFVFGLRSTADDRTNLALVNAGTSGPVTLRVTLYSSDARRFTLPDTTLDAGQWVQIPRVLDPAGFANGWAKIDVVAGFGPYIAYAVFNDNTTNDGSYAPCEAAQPPAEPRVLPVLVESATFQSELVLTNPTGAPETANLSYVESASPEGGAGGSVTLGLQPAEQKIIPGAIDFLRQKGIAIGPKGSAAFIGALRAVFTSGGSIANGFVGARTAASVNGTGQGEYGLFYPGVGPTFAATADTWVFGLQQNGASRSNLAVVNLGDVAAPLSFRVDVYDGDTGRLAGSTSPATLAPGGWTQVNAILQPFGIANGYAHVLKLAGAGRFLAYGVVNDGATPASGATNDGSYIAMSSY